jgi:hypothetical protein
MNASFQSGADEALTRFNAGGSMDLRRSNKALQRARIEPDTEILRSLDRPRILTAKCLFPAFNRASWLTRNNQT